MKNVEGWRTKCYSDVPTEMYRQLKAFRENYPYKQLEVAGSEWNYIVCGDASEALLILTGTTATGESSWRDVLKYGGNFRVVSPSYPPVGTMDRVVEGVRAVLDAEGIARAHIIGISLGSAVAHVFIRRYPERVGKLVLTSFGMPDASFVKGMRSTVRMLSVLPWWMIKRSMASGSGQTLSDLQDEEASFVSAYFRDINENDMNKRTYVGHFKITLDLVTNTEALRMHEPVDGTGRVLIIQAEDDELFNAEQRQALAGTYPGAKSHIFDSGGHLLALVRAQEMANVIEGFLAS